MRWIGFLLNLAVMAALGVAYMAPYLDPRTFWPAAFAGLVFPILVGLQGLFLIFWLAGRKWVFAGIAAVALLPALRESAHYLRWPYVSFGKERSVEGLDSLATAQPSSLRILSWNVRVFNKNTPDVRFAGRDSILALLAAQQPDVICFQEYFTMPTVEGNDHQKLVREATGLPYFSFWEALRDKKGRQWGLAIVSRYPVLEAGEVDFPGGGVLNGCQYADLETPSGRIRIFNTHLQSIHLSTEDFGLDDAVSELSEANTRRVTLLKFRDAYQARADQATRLEDAVLDSPWPVVLCGDFNDPPQSYAYHRVSFGLQDAFSVAGRGLARTHASLPGVRIDYVLVDTALEVLRYSALPRKITDHYPIVVELGK
ncbi:MAG: hypothetical protein GC205_05195 [Bacteroidetes bacterium]|nr:hypothetical protein [Bacteroidota bacterium]